MDDVERAWIGDTEWWYRHTQGFDIKDNVEIPDWIEEEKYG